ncbi:MAG: hypothetical protein U0822_00135 [Anaerolineae bacterium]
MANTLLAVMPLDTNIVHTVQELKRAGLHDISFIVGQPISGDEKKLAGLAPAPEVAAVMQILGTDAHYDVPGVGSVSLSGPAAKFNESQHDNSHDFFTALLGHDEDAATTSAIGQYLADGHAVLAMAGDLDAANRILGRRPLATYA